MEKRKILIVDDEINITAVLKLMIEKTGKYEVRTETKGSKAFAVVKKFKPDLVLLDIMMPDVGGGEVAAQMRADKETNHIPIVFISAAITKEEARKKGTIQGGIPIIAKPVPMAELIDAIEKYIDKKTKARKKTGAPSTEGEKEFPDLDRRKYNRMPTYNLLSYVCLDENGSPSGEGIGKALNVGQGGIRLETYLPVETEYIQLTTSDANEELINIKGKVIYSESAEPQVFHIGVNFNEPNEKIREFVVDMVRVFSLQKGEE